MKKSIVAVLFAGMTILMLGGCGSKSIDDIGLTSDSLAENYQAPMLTENEGGDSDTVQPITENDAISDGTASQNNDGASSDTKTDASTTDKDSTAAQADYTVDLEKYADTENCTITYPVISGWANEEAQTTWNDTFEQLAKKEQDSLGEKDTAQMEFEITEQNANILSLKVTTSEFWDGAAHPISYCDTYNIDMETGESLTLSDQADVEKIADILLTTKDYEIQTDGITMDDILTYNFPTGTPDRTTLAFNLGGFDKPLDELLTDADYVCFGSSYVEDGNVVLVFEANHAMGDYVCVMVKQA